MTTHTQNDQPPPMAAISPPARRDLATEHEEIAPRQTRTSPLFVAKMRASSAGRHISGAERIVHARQVADTLAALARRALEHANGTPDALVLKATAIAAPRHIPALPVSTCDVASPEDGWREVERILLAASFAQAPAIRTLFPSCTGMRGAMLLDADTLERLEPDRERGVRATNMDASNPSSPDRKNHFAEALVLATKVMSAPNLVGEICVSDDPDYVTGYVATKAFGYRRITRLKAPGDPAGGRIFLYRGPRADVAKTIAYLEREPVIVDTAPPPSVDRFSALEKDLDAIKSRGLYRAPSVRGTSPLVDFSSNDYLGLAGHPDVREAAAEAARRYGAGSGASRLVSGTLPPHLALEAALARFKGAEAAIVFSSGYLANLGTVSALVGKGDVVFSDELNHASIIDGCRLSGARIVVYPHLDVEALDRLLAEHPAPRRLAVSDGVFSMDGDCLDLPRFLHVCRRHGAFSMVDEAHALGVVGATGHGLVERFGSERPDFMMGTLSKALGSAGGYVAGSRLAIDYLRQKARSYIFSTAPDPAAMAGALKALELLDADPGRVARLRQNTAVFVRELARHGIAAATQSAIVPILIGDERQAVAASAALARQGFAIPAIRYPTVARGRARLRAAVNARHAESDLVRAAQAVAAALPAAKPTPSEPPPTPK